MAGSGGSARGPGAGRTRWRGHYILPTWGFPALLSVAGKGSKLISAQPLIGDTCHRRRCGSECGGRTAPWLPCASEGRGGGLETNF